MVDVSLTALLCLYCVIILILYSPEYCAEGESLSVPEEEDLSALAL